MQFSLLSCLFDSDSTVPAGFPCSCVLFASSFFFPQRSRNSQQANQAGQWARLREGGTSQAQNVLLPMPDASALLRCRQFLPIRLVLLLPALAAVEIPDVAGDRHLLLLCQPLRVLLFRHQHPVNPPRLRLRIHQLEERVDLYVREEWRGDGGGEVGNCAGKNRTKTPVCSTSPQPTPPN